MLLFWLLAGGLAAAAAVLIAWSAARRASAARSGEDPRTVVYRRQLEEVRELADRGLLGSQEVRAAEAEAGRRLLAGADAPDEGWRPAARTSRHWALAAGAVAAAAALGLYLVVGAPGMGDRPFASRLATWRRADPSALEPQQLAAVLASVARERPRDPEVLEFLGRAHLASGASGDAIQAFTRAARLKPQSAALQAELGEALTLGAGGKVTPEAEAAFRRALAIDQSNQAARYFLGRRRMETGDPAGAQALWRPLLAELPPTDPRRAPLSQELARASGEQGLPPKLDEATSTLARGMVARLAGRLRERPDDPEGWARLVRAYGVLGDKPAQQQALAQARKLFADRPEVLARIAREAQPSR